MVDERFTIFGRFSPEARQQIIALFNNRTEHDVQIGYYWHNRPMQVGKSQRVIVCPLGCALVTDHLITPMPLLRSGGSPDGDVLARRLMRLSVRDAQKREAGMVADEKYDAIKDEAEAFYLNWDRGRIDPHELFAALTEMGLPSQEGVAV